MLKQYKYSSVVDKLKLDCVCVCVCNVFCQLTISLINALLKKSQNGALHQNFCCQLGIHLKILIIKGIFNSKFKMQNITKQEQSMFCIYCRI